MASNSIHPSAVIGPEVRLGSENVIGPNVVLDGRITIGDGNRFFPGACVGSLSRQRMHDHRPRHELHRRPEVVIGDENLFYENSSVHAPMGRLTSLGDRIAVGANVHIGHDATLHNDVVLAPSVVIGGYATILRFATLGMSSTVHQRLTVGGFAMVGAGAVVVENIAPASVVSGVPARFKKVNQIAIQRYLNADTGDALTKWLTGGTPPLESSAMTLVSEFVRALRRDYLHDRMIPSEIIVAPLLEADS